ncbi:MAG: FAD-binding oxidoreductase [Ignavibacteria bacterium]|nr:FAD-binding oxidoreductase [Ignavibacteria bacterium]
MNNSNLSFWERDSYLNRDFIVIGGGIIGLSTAISIRERAPNASILVLERGLFPSGASTKNAGFACFGSLTEILSDYERIGEAATLEVIERRWHGLHILRNRLGDQAIGFEQYGGYELLFDEQASAIEHIDHVNSLLHPLFQRDVFSVNPTAIEQFGLNADLVNSVVENPFEGQIHTGKMMQALTRYASERGIEIRTGAKVVHLSDTGSRVEVTCRHEGESVNFSATHVAVCTNALIPDLLPELSIKPGRGQVLITAPIENLRIKGAFHFDEGFYYFRNVGDRVLFGGGRNLDFEGEETSEFGLTPNIQDTLEQLLTSVILPDTPFNIEQRWAGIMGFSTTKMPVVTRVSERITVGFGCNGMGVALGSEIGSTAAAMCCA